MSDKTNVLTDEELARYRDAIESDSYDFSDFGDIAALVATVDSLRSELDWYRSVFMTRFRHDDVPHSREALYGMRLKVQISIPDGEPEWVDWKTYKEARHGK